MLLRRAGAAIRARDWVGVAIEFVIVVLGIFVALQVGDWNQARIDRHQEKAYISRLTVETRANLDMLKQMELIYEDKIHFILALPDMGLDEAVRKDPQGFMRRLDDSSFIAIPNMQSGTYDELESSGRLSLIRNPRVRTAIANNLNGYRSTMTVEQQPIGDYRRILFETLPGRSYYNYRAGPGASNVAAIVNAVDAFRKDPRFNAGANAEVTYGSDTLYWIRYFRGRTEHVLALLEAEGSSSGSPASASGENQPWLKPSEKRG